jgi:spore coat polysaccharide biosynthesis predicted glycosyltransferase SpsG
MRIALRFDVSPEIGTGHLMRARVLAAELTRREMDHALVTPDPAHIEEHALPAMPGWEQTFTHVIADICHAASDPAGEIQRLAGAGLKTAVIDSMPPHHFTGTGADLVITPYLGADTLRPKPEVKTWATGPDYAILDPAFTALRDTPGDGSVLIGTGGSDPEELAAEILGALAPSDLAITVAIGAFFEPAHKARLEAMANARPGTRLIEGAGAFRTALAQSSLLIGRVGLIRYEAACLSKPMMLVQESLDYAAYLKGFEASGIARIYLRADPKDRARLTHDLGALINPATRAPLMAPNTRGAALVDGQGAAKVLDLFLGQGHE